MIAPTRLNTWTPKAFAETETFRWRWGPRINIGDAIVDAGAVVVEGDATIVSVTFDPIEHYSYVQLAGGTIQSRIDFNVTMASGDFYVEPTFLPVAL